MATKQELIDAWAEWLGQLTWDWFGTLTHKGYPSRTALVKKFDRWISELKRAHGTASFRYAMVLETGAYRDNNHIHFLLGGLDKKVWNFPFPWRDRWQEIAGQAVIARFNPEQGGIRYLLKSLLPERDFEITLHFDQQPMLRSGK